MTKIHPVIDHATKAKSRRGIFYAYIDHAKKRNLDGVYFTLTEELIRQENDASSSLATEKSLNTIYTEIEEILNNCFEEILDVISELEKMYHKYFKENLNATIAISSPSPGLSSLRKKFLVRMIFQK